jgi:PAS domain S-box-containing protein
MPLKNDDGTLRGFAKIMREDTDQKLSEEKLEQSKLQHEELLASINDSFFRLDGEFRFTYVNQATTKTIGLAETDFLGKTIWEMFPYIAGNNFHAEVRRAFDEQTKIVFENYYPPFDRWFENRVYPTGGGLSIFTTEITNRKRAEAVLRESEEKYRTLFNSIDEGFCVLEMIFDETKKAVDYRFLKMSPSFEKLTGIPADEALRGKTITEMVPNIEEKWFEITGAWL